MIEHSSSHQIHQDASPNEETDFNETKENTTAEYGIRKRRNQQHPNSDNDDHETEHTQKINDEKQKNHIRNTLTSAGKGLSYLLCKFSQSRRKHHYHIL